MKMGTVITWERQMSLVSVYMSSEAWPYKWSNSKRWCLWVSVSSLLLPALPPMILLYYLMHFYAPSLLLILFPLLWRSLSPCCYLSTHPSKSPPPVQPPPITRDSHGLLCGSKLRGYNSSSIIAFYHWLWGRSVPLYSQPPEGLAYSLLSFVCLFVCFPPLGIDMHIIGSKKDVCWC